MGKETTEENQLMRGFQQACTSLKRDEEWDESLKDKAEEVLSKSTALGLRKLAAELLHRTGQRRMDWLGLAAAIDVDGPPFLLALLRRWLDSYGTNSQIGSSSDEFLFYSRFIEKISKERKLVREKLAQDEFSHLKRELVFVALTLSELRNENYTPLFKALVKLNKSEEELLEMAGICQEIGVYLPGNLLLISLISKECQKKLPFFNDWRRSIPTWAANQELSSAASPLISEFLNHDLEETVEAVIPLLLSNSPVVFGSVLRCWLHRWPKESHGLEAIQLVLQKLEKRCQEQFDKPREQYWPPKLEYFEDFTCIDPEWKWEESSGVTWPEDRLLTAFIAVWEALYEKFTTKKAREIRLLPENRFLGYALAWHDQKTRIKAEKLLKLIGGSSQAAEDAETSDKEDQPVADKVYVPEDLEVPEIPKEEPNLVTFVDDLLRKHGSEKEGHVPPFPTVHLRFKELGIHERVFVKQISDSIELVASSGEILEGSLKKTEFFWRIVARTRVKAIVDAGCTTIEELFEKEKTLADGFFPKLMDYLLSPRTEVRTLVLSRLLWSCCQNNGNYFNTFWEKIQSCLSLTTDSSVLARILKTVKHFVSQNDCRLPEAAYSILFSFCLEVQNSSNFLARSAAIIVFGFLLKKITAYRKLPLFVIIGSQKTLWNQWRENKLQQLSILPKAQRILLLTLLKKYILVHTEFYSDYELETISRLLCQVELLRAESPDIRERRFCVDVLFQLTPPGKHQELRYVIRNVSLFSETGSFKMNREEYFNSQEDQNYLRFRMEQMDGKEKEPKSLTLKQIEAIAGCSEYYKFRQKHYEMALHPPPRRVPDDNDDVFSGVFPDGTNERFLMKFEMFIKNKNELAMQNYVLANEVEVWQNPKTDLGHHLSAFSSFRTHGKEFPRIQSLLSRIPVAAGKASFYKNVQDPCYVTRYEYANE